MGLPTPTPPGFYPTQMLPQKRKKKQNKKLGTRVVFMFGGFTKVLKMRFVRENSEQS